MTASPSGRSILRDRLDHHPACLNILDFKDTVRARMMLFNDVSHYEGVPEEY